MCRLNNILPVILCFAGILMSCNQRTGGNSTTSQSKVPVATDSVILTRSVNPYPAKSEDTSLFQANEDSTVLIYAIHNDDCRWSYDCVAKTMDNKWWNYKIISDNMVNLFDDISIRTMQINGRGNHEIVLEYNLSGHHLYDGDFMGGGDEDLGGWSMYSKEVEIWDIDDGFHLLYACTPHSANWSKESADDKDHFDYYKYDFSIDSSLQIVLSNPMKKVKDEIVPDRSRSANSTMGRYKYQSDSFVYIGR
jgi:hypothetical protein